MKKLSQTWLKLIAAFTMLLDHIGYAFIHKPYGAYVTLRAVGRLSFPIYCFLITEGVVHTKNPWKYLLRLAILAVVSEFAFDLMREGHLTWEKQSVMLTLFMGAVMCIIMNKLPKLWMKPFVVIPFYFLVPFLQSDYGNKGILIIAMFMLTRQLPWKDLWRVLLMGALCLYFGGVALRVLGFAIPNYWFAFFAMVPILFYSGEKGNAPKALTVGLNLFYPVHMAIIAAIKLIFF